MRDMIDRSSGVKNLRQQFDNLTEAEQFLFKSMLFVYVLICAAVIIGLWESHRNDEIVRQNSIYNQSQICDAIEDTRQSFLELVIAAQEIDEFPPGVINNPYFDDLVKEKFALPPPECEVIKARQNELNGGVPDREVEGRQ